MLQYFNINIISKVKDISAKSFFIIYIVYVFIYLIYWRLE